MSSEQPQPTLELKFFASQESTHRALVQLVPTDMGQTLIISPDLIEAVSGDCACAVLDEQPIYNADSRNEC